MALATGTVFEIRATATTGNVNGSGFNPANANFPTDLTATSATGNSPVVSSATYTFVAGDVNAWLYVRTGTNWTPGWYQIASVSAGAATLAAAIGQAVQVNSTTNLFVANTVAGVATTASPTAGTFGIDYSQQDTAQATATDYTSVGSSSTLTSVSAGFTRMMVGNFFHQTTTGTGAFGVTGWYEIVSYTSSTSVTLDRTPNNGTASVACTGFVGGAGRLNALEDAYFEMQPTGAIGWIKSGSYTISASISIASGASILANPIMNLGYKSLRGDVCNDTDRPLLTFGASIFVIGIDRFWQNLRITGTPATLVTLSVNSSFENCYIINTSTTTTRVAVSLTVNAFGRLYSCELISQNGTAVSNASGTNPGRIVGCYVHDSSVGISSPSPGLIINNNIIAACNTTGISLTNTNPLSYIVGNTLYGSEAKMGTAIDLTSANSSLNLVLNNIIYGFTTGISVNTGFAGNFSDYNDFFNNTTEVTNWYKGATDLALNPNFVGASQITGTTATTSGSVLTQSGGNFASVTDNVSFLRVTSGTGVTVGNYLITSHTTTTLTVNNALGTSSAGDVNYFVTVGTNFTPGTNLSGVGGPTYLGAGVTVLSYPDVGGIQRNPAGSSGSAYTFVS